MNSLGLIPTRMSFRKDKLDADISNYSKWLPTVRHFGKPQLLDRLLG